MASVSLLDSTEAIGIFASLLIIAIVLLIWGFSVGKPALWIVGLLTGIGAGGFGYAFKETIGIVEESTPGSHANRGNYYY